MKAGGLFVRVHSFVSRPALVALVLLLLPLILLAGPGSFRFAFLSDTHIGSPNADEDLRAAVRDINAMSDLKFVVLSGDVT